MSPKHFNALMAIRVAAKSIFQNSHASNVSVETLIAQLRQTADLAEAELSLPAEECRSVLLICGENVN